MAKFQMVYTDSIGEECVKKFEVQDQDEAEDYAMKQMCEDPDVTFVHSVGPISS